MDKEYLAVSPIPDPSALHIPGWVMPASSILFSIIATSVTITFFLSRLQNKLSLFDQKVSGKFDNILLMMEFKDKNLQEMNHRLSKMEDNFNQLTRYVNGERSHSFTPRRNLEE